MYPCEKVFHVVELDSSVVQFLREFVERLLPNGCTVDVAVKVRSRICLIFDGATEAAHEAEQPPGDMAAVPAGIPAVTGGTTKAHANAEQLCENATNNGLEAENYGPRVSGCQLPSGIIGGDEHGCIGGFPYFWAGPLSEDRAAWVGLSVSREFDVQRIVA